MDYCTPLVSVQVLAILYGISTSHESKLPAVGTLRSTIVVKANHDLLYLRVQVPAMLLPMVLLAWRRGELGALWHGHFGRQPDSSSDEAEHLIEPPTGARGLAGDLPV